MPDLKAVCPRREPACNLRGARGERRIYCWSLESTSLLPYGYGDATMPSACAKSHKRRSGLGLQIGIVK